MRCPICEELNREYDSMCELEATIVLRQRHRMLHPAEVVAQEKDESGDLLLLSRKRQAKIVSTLESHRARAHSA